ncbi:BTB/POZ domain-containing protein At3g50780-like isoform X1 [Zingiber officinale]|uniref:BTB/POZ domain-containing protein At3g50780-like isoform X1 n=1 Tax=Zingiber officinale TaxID=94328 RepID=UPI001C4B8178|nr:BTB/POZ domain-containing protein At3g50780-like isoform X1 [Zingiber officinale]
MADFRVGRIEQGQTRIRNVPIAVTPEGFWCCPSPAVLQKTLKNHHNHQSKHKVSSPLPSKSSSFQRTANSPSDRKPHSGPLGSKVVSDDQRLSTPDVPTATPTNVAEKAPERQPERPPKPTIDNPQRKISVGYGRPETSDLKVILFGKEGIHVTMNVHWNVLAENSSFFASKLSRQSPLPAVEIADCEDVEIFVETVGLMYCKELKVRLIKQSVPRVLRILKVAESLGFRECIKSCLDYLEAVPWVAEEEDNVVSSVRHLQNYGSSPVLKRVASDLSNPPNDTLAHIMDLVLKSNEDRGRREMKTLVLKLLKENNSCASGSVNTWIQLFYRSCTTCVESLLNLFRQASEPGFSDCSSDCKDPMRQIALEADNLIWLVEILVDRHAADEFATMWASQTELAGLHSKLPIMSRHLVSCITSRIFVGIGRGEILPTRETRQLLLQTWLQPLIDDYSWLQHGCRSFDRKVVEEGIGQTILTLPLEDQRSILLSWLGSFLKVGDNCPNLQRAFKVWWRRTFVRPYAEQQATNLPPERSLTFKMERRRQVCFRFGCLEEI